MRGLRVPCSSPVLSGSAYFILFSERTGIAQILVQFIKKIATSDLTCFIMNRNICIHQWTMELLHAENVWFEFLYQDITSFRGHLIYIEKHYEKGEFLL